MNNTAAITQDQILYVVKEVGEATLEDLATHLNVHKSTILRKADGLVSQGKLTHNFQSLSSGRPTKVYKYGDGTPEQGVLNDGSQG